ncbi:MAG: serine phosphatase RsbU (regulator of sigma subunit) [bacterium]
MVIQLRIIDIICSDCFRSADFLKKLGFIIIIFFYSYQFVYAGTYVLSGNKNVHSVLSVIDMLEDKQGKWTSNDITSLGLLSQFQNTYQNHSKPFNFRLTESIFWLKYTIDNQSDLKSEWLFELSSYFIDGVDVYVKINNGKFKPYSNSQLKDYENFLFRSHEYVYPVKFPAKSKVTFLIRIKGTFTSFLVTRLWKPIQYIESVNYAQGWFGLVYGALFLITLYNFLIYIWTREVANVLYAMWLLVVTFVLFIVEHQLSPLLGVNVVGIETILFPYTHFLISFLSILLFRKLLFIHKIFPELVFALKFLEKISLLGLVITPFGSNIWFMRLSGAWLSLIAIIILILIIVCCFRGYRFPLFYLGCFLPLVIGVLGHQLIYRGVIEFHPLLRWGHFLGTFFQALLMSFFLAERINFLQRQKNKAAQKVIENIDKTYNLKQALIKQLETQSQSLEFQIEDRTKKLKLKNLQMKGELKIAAEVQQSILKNQVEVPFASTAMLYIPYDRVSGDTYRFSKSREGVLNFFLGDATGHGISAAFITMMAQMAIVSLRKNLSPLHVAQKINHLLNVCLPSDKFMTGISMQIFPEGLLKTCNAGHPPLIVLPANGRIQILNQKNGGALGMFKEEIISYEEDTYQLNAGDRIFAYTDGITEHRNHFKEEYGLHRLVTFLENHKALTLQESIDSLLEQLLDFSSRKKPSDDFTLIAFEYTSTSSQ